MSRQIVLIDDDDDDAIIFSEALNAIAVNASMVHYADGIKAISELSRESNQLPDVIFMDVNMPSIDGWECLRKIKAHALLNKIPVVMYSTANLEEQGLVAKDMGADALLMKPRNFEELKQKLSLLFKKLWPAP